MRGEEHDSACLGYAMSGITSACAEKRPTPNRKIWILGNYLRMRGEEVGYEHPGMGRAELPPHARRRVGSINIRNSFRGITSACAEKRTAHTLTSKKPRNYLRMRGEEWPSSLFSSQFRELPPHARRRGRPPTGKFGFWGITSACAEKSEVATLFDIFEEELPPHARRRACFQPDFVSIPGITSACAEKSPHRTTCQQERRNYLRMRGEEA